ncbi:hypothetical protein MHH52_18255 [Paenibacillus sp. FSL K6-0276]|uniref:hypothetical protein n=1 Tax=Paenibacillus sp. FSL K6-0276 TaxID=2921450 RepID=UPI0030EB9B78
MNHSIIVPVNHYYYILPLFTESLMRTVEPFTKIIFINDGSVLSVQEDLENLQRARSTTIKIEIIRLEDKVQIYQ